MRPVEMPTTPVACGEGASGELLGDVEVRGTAVQFGEVAPIYRLGSSDAPAVLSVVPTVPSSFQLWIWGFWTTFYPDVGVQPPREAWVRVASENFESLPSAVIIDEVDATSACLAGRFSVDFDGEATGRLAGWFRTR